MHSGISANRKSKAYKENFSFVKWADRGIDSAYHI